MLTLIRVLWFSGAAVTGLIVSFFWVSAKCRIGSQRNVDRDRSQNQGKVCWVKIIASEVLWFPFSVQSFIFYQSVGQRTNFRERAILSQIVTCAFFAPSPSISSMWVFSLVVNLLSSHKVLVKQNQYNRGVLSTRFPLSLLGQFSLVVYV